MGGAIGLTNGNAKLSDAICLEIIALRAKTGMAYHKIGSKYGVSKVTVRRLCLGLARPYIPRQPAELVLPPVRTTHAPLSRCKNGHNFYGTGDTCFHCVLLEQRGLS